MATEGEEENYLFALDRQGERRGGILYTGRERFSTKKGTISPMIEFTEKGPEFFQKCREGEAFLSRKGGKIYILLL